MYECMHVYIDTIYVWICIPPEKERKYSEL